MGIIKIFIIAASINTLASDNIDNDFLSNKYLEYKDDNVKIKDDLIEINKLLDEGNYFQANKKINTIDEESLNDENKIKLNQIKLKIENIQENKNDLEKETKKIKKMSYNKALEKFQSIEYLGTDHSYQNEVKEIKEILAKKQEKENLDQELRILNREIKKMNDEDYEQAENYIKEFEGRKFTKKQKKKFENIKQYVSFMKASYEDLVASDNIARQILEDELQDQEEYYTNYVTYTYSLDGVDEVFEGMINDFYSSLNVPYIWAGSSKSGWDCSGMISYMYRNHLGINLAHNAQQQSYYGREVTDLKPGDLVFFGNGRNSITHVGMIIGYDENGNGDLLFGHAANPSSGTKIDYLSSPWYAQRLVSARRIVE